MTQSIIPPQWFKLIAFNLVPVSAILTALHGGYLDIFFEDELLGPWVGVISFVFLWAVASLMMGRHDLSGFLGRRLTLLGMLGTLHGFIIAFSAVSLMAAGSLDATKESINSITQGLSVALYTTVLGVVYKIWLDLLARWCK